MRVRWGSGKGQVRWGEGQVRVRWGWNWAVILLSLVSQIVVIWPTAGQGFLFCDRSNNSNMPYSLKASVQLCSMRSQSAGLNWISQDLLLDSNIGLIQQDSEFANLEIYPRCLSVASWPAGGSQVLFILLCCSSRTRWWPWKSTQEALCRTHCLLCRGSLRPTLPSCTMPNVHRALPRQRLRDCRRCRPGASLT